MSMTETREDALLHSVLPRYEAKGFTVVVHPSSSFLPPFMGKYRPDAIALSPAKKIAIEVKLDDSSTTDVKEVAELFAQHPDWELRIFYLSSLSRDQRLEPPTDQSIERAISEISELKVSGHIVAAIMLAWSTLEAIARSLLPETLARPQPAARLVEVLASEGLITPSEADSLRRAVEMRNAVAHGDIGREVSAEHVDELAASLRLLAGLSRKARSPVSG